MDSQQQSRGESGMTERWSAPFTALWNEHRRLAAEHHRLAEQWAELQSSTAWKLTQRLAKGRQRLMPEGSRRQKWLRRCVNVLRLWRAEGTKTVLRRMAGKFRSGSEATSAPSVRADTRMPVPSVNTGHRALVHPADVSPAPIPHEDKFRVAFIGSEVAADFASMRYRAHNLIEGLAQVGVEGTFVSQDAIAAQLPSILSHDLIILARRILNDAITTLISAARRRRLPIVYDIDDYIFDPWIMPYVEAFHNPDSPPESVMLQFVDKVGACLDQCDYFTGSTTYLAEKATILGKNSFVIPNGLNEAQLLLSRLALEQRNTRRRGKGTRIGYFSGTRSHQADFRVVYPALMRLFHEERDIRLVIVGHLDVTSFPGLAPFRDQIEQLPLRHWSELPATIADVDVNIIPLEMSPFNEGKSNLKYYEAGLVQVPSIASPTQINRENITHGLNGLLAWTPEEWYAGLKELIARPDWRRQVGQNAYEHVLEHYTPAAIAAKAAAAYRQILRLHRARRDAPKQALRIVLLAAGPGGGWDETLRIANELAAAGHAVTVYVSRGETLTTAAEKAIARRFFEVHFTVQSGGEVPACDLLIADPQTIELAKTNQHRARVAIADEELWFVIHRAGRGMESLLHDWLQNGPVTHLPSRAA